MPPDRYVASKPEPGLVAGIILAAGESRASAAPSNCSIFTENPPLGELRVSQG